MAADLREMDEETARRQYQFRFTMPEIQPVQPGTGDANMHDTARLRVGLLPRDGGMKATQ
jgi:hypothetical protein